jgi:glucosamine-6-phosphate deaminase
VLDPLGIQASHRHLLRSDNPNPQEECVRNNKEIDKIECFDLFMDGIGENGHIAFNEPSTYFEARTHIADISESTRIANARFFSSLDEVPQQALSVGFEDIMKSKMIILVATGTKKALVIKKLISETNITCDFPISFLRMHNNVTIVLDKLACGSCLDQLT